MATVQAAVEQQLDDDDKENERKIVLTLISVAASVSIGRETVDRMSRRTERMLVGMTLLLLLLLDSNADHQSSGL